MKLKAIGIFFSIVVIAFIVACGSDSSSINDNTSSNNNNVPSDDSNSTIDYRITLTNITHSQPLSPIAVILHGKNYIAWEDGLPISNGLEILAEGGDPTDFIQAAENDNNVFAAKTGTGVILPGGNESLSLRVDTSERDTIYLTIATMLVNTNDAFGGVNAKSISHLELGQSLILMAPAYDAGTEGNSESLASVPGPAAGGEGFNTSRDDVDFVRIHSGIISSEDGLENSVLTGSHHWDNPVFKLVVTRIS